MHTVDIPAQMAYFQSVPNISTNTQRNMKIAVTIVESLAKAGGYEIFTFNLLKGLAQKGHDVTLYAPKKRLQKDRLLLAQLPITTRPLPPRAVTLSKHCPALLAMLMRLEQRRFNYDVWQVMGAYPEASLVRGLSGHVPLVLRAHGDDIQCAPELGYGMRLSPAIDTAIRANLSSMDKVVALTPGLRENLIELGVHHNNIVVIPNGINLAQFTKKRNLKKVRADRGITPQDFLILTVGRNHAKKGYDHIPKMASALMAKGKKFQWLVVGHDTEKLTPELVSRGLDSIVIPIPPITVSPITSTITDIPADELVDLYRAADLFVFPSRLETFGRVIIEAMAAQTPVVTTDALGCRDVSGMGKYAKMLPVDDTNAMTDAIFELMENADARDELSALGRIQAERHDWTTVTTSYLACYEMLLKKNQK